MSPRIYRPHSLRAFLLLLLVALIVATVSAGQPVYRIMPVGDSITEGGKTFSNYRYPLWEKLGGKSVIRWVRHHAGDLGVDPNRVTAAGASAGGQVAAAAGLVPGLDEPGEDGSVSSRPNALVLWYAVVENGPDGYGSRGMKARYREVSPLHNITSNAPPTLFLLGTQDSLIPVSTAEAFKARMEQAGGRCELVLFPGAGHPIYDYRRGGSSLREQILREVDRFLADILH